MVAFFFYFFAALLLCSSTMVILARNPVNSVLLLIFSFFVSAGLFVLLEAEMLAMLLIIIYVGAVAVLFLFVVMMLDIDFSRLREGFVKYCALGFTCASAFFGGLALIIYSSDRHAVSGHEPMTIDSDNISEIGRILYTKYMYAFHLSSVLLLLSIVGAIVLTLRTRRGARKQNVSEQVRRSSVLKHISPKIGGGIEWKD